MKTISRSYIFNCDNQKITLEKALSGNFKPANINVSSDFQGKTEIAENREEINNEKFPGSEVVIGNGTRLDIEATVIRLNELGSGGRIDDEFVFTFELVRQDGKILKDRIIEIISEEEGNEAIFKIVIALLNNS